MIRTVTYAFLLLLLSQRVESAPLSEEKREKSAPPACEAVFEITGTGVINDTACIGTLIQITDLSTADNGIETWSWFVNGQLVSQDQIFPPFAPSTEGIYTIELQIQDAPASCARHSGNRKKSQKIF